MFFAGIAPNEAISNLGKWSVILGIPLPNFLKSKGADVWTFYVCGLLFISYVAYLLTDRPKNNWSKIRTRANMVVHKWKISKTPLFAALEILY